MGTIQASNKDRGSKPAQDFIVYPGIERVLVYNKSLEFS